MTNNVATQTNGGGGLVQLDPEAFAERLAQLGDELQGRKWVGTLLKFNKGKFLAGKEDRVIPIGTRLVAALDTIEIGYEQWLDGTLITSRTGFLAEGFQWPARDELGDMDRNNWPVDVNTGQRKDPWQKTMRLVLYRAKDDKSNLYTFVTRSFGGMGAIGDLATTAGKEVRMHKGSYPAIELGASTYKNQRYKSIVDVPTFKICGWEPAWQGAEIRRVTA
jgi:hypothetical protein